MVIKASSAGEVRGLMDALLGLDAVAREAAAARLTVIGPRAVDHLTAAYSRAETDGQRLAVLRVLESIGESRAITTARHALTQSPDVALAGVHVMHALLEVPDAHARNEALDLLVAAAMDPAGPPALRHAALDALHDLPADVRSRVADALGDAQAGPPEDPVEVEADTSIWRNALEGRLPDHPDPLVSALRTGARTAHLTSLHTLIDALRAREKSAGDEEGEWRALRGAVHLALAQRGSRVALYDLREALAEAARPLPVSFLAAVHVLGDSTCLEPLAAAYVKASADETWWRQQIASAFHAVMTREKLTRRSAAVKRIAARWPAASPLLASQPAQ